MLQFLRKKSQSLVIQAIVVVIALVFIFWGVGTNLMNKQRDAALSVNGEEISFQKFQQAYDQAYSRIAQQFGGTIPKGLAESLNIKQQVISQLSQEALLRQGGEELGLRVSGAEVQKKIESMVQFQENGKFNLERYNAVLAANRLSPTNYEDSLRYEMLADKTVNAVTSFAIVASASEIEDLYSLEKETVSVFYTVISPKNLEAGIEVNDDELKQWYQNNADSYKTEAMVKLSYLAFTYEAIGKKITIDNEAVKAYYDEHLTDYQTPEKRHARHILFKVDPDAPEEVQTEQRRKAEEVLQKARAGEDFAKLASTYSEGPTAANGGDLGFFSRGQMVKPFDDAVFSMKKGEISDIVKTDFGYHIIKLEEIQLAGVTPLDQVRDTIAKTLKLEQAKPMAFQLANTAYEEIISSGSLSAYLKNNPDANVVETDFFSRSNPPGGVTSDPTFLDRAFSLKEGELSSLTEVADGYVIISATALKDPQTRDLGEIREQVVKDYQAEKAKEKARVKAEQLIGELQQEAATFTAVAEKEGFSVQVSGQLLKNDPDHKSGFPQALVQNVFLLSHSNPVAQEPGVVGDDYYVYMLDKREPPKTKLSDADRDRYKKMLLQYKQQQLLADWLKNRQAEADIRVHQNLQSQ